VETLGAGVFCSFHQTIPGDIQVVVPVGHIWRRTDSHQTRDLNLKMRFNGGYKISPPITTSRLMRVHVQHSNGRWCPADHALSTECDGVVDGWPSTHA
jgi:hypothetical protein